MKKIFEINRIHSIMDFILKPITSHIGFFINVILLMIIPTLLNAYFVNPDSYLHFTSERILGFWVKNGASFPYILFFPTVVLYSVCTFLCFIRSNRIKFCIKCGIYLVFIFLYTINIFLLFNFKTMISPTIVLLLEETTDGETSDFLKTYLFSIQSLWSYLLVIITFAILSLLEKMSSHTLRFFDKWYVSLLGILFLFYFAMRFPSTAKGFCSLFRCKRVSDIEFWYLNYPPDSNTLTNVFYSIIANNISHKEIIESKKATLGYLGPIESSSDVTLVLVIGESYSKYHSNLYGYIRNTCPYLKREEEKGNLFVFRDVISPYNMTSYVMKNLFSTNSIMDNEDWASYPIFPVYFKSAGFNVFFWDNQKTKSDVSDFSIFSYIYDIDIAKVSYTKCNDDIFQYDMDLVKSFFASNVMDDGKNLLIFHLLGQHAMAETKYPHSVHNMKFLPDSISGDYSLKQKSQIAHYDNATCYNDSVLEYVICQLRNLNSVLVYFSDHGEEVYDYRNHYGRTQEKVKTKEILKYQYEIPFMIWCSNKFKEVHPDVVDRIQSAINKPFMIDNTCQILFDLAGMGNCAYYHKERDLISPSYQPYAYRRVQDNVIYEDVMKETSIK